MKSIKKATHLTLLPAIEATITADTLRSQSYALPSIFEPKEAIPAEEEMDPYIAFWEDWEDLVRGTHGMASLLARAYEVLRGKINTNTNAQRQDVIALSTLFYYGHPELMLHPNDFNDGYRCEQVICSLLVCGHTIDEQMLENIIIPKVLLQAEANLTVPELFKLRKQALRYLQKATTYMGSAHYRQCLEGRIREARNHFGVVLPMKAYLAEVQPEL